MRPKPTHYIFWMFREGIHLLCSLYERQKVITDTQWNNGTSDHQNHQTPERLWESTRSQEISDVEHIYLKSN